MATMVGTRIEAGLGDAGNIGIYEFVTGLNDPDVETVSRFEVRMGNHTVATRGSLEEAMAVASALQVEPTPGQDVVLSPEYSAYVEARRDRAPGTRRG